MTRTPADAFPPLGLRIEAGPLVLRSVTDDVLPLLVDAALSGVHDPAVMPFLVPWTEVPAARLPADFARFHWGTRATWAPEHWQLELAVVWDGEVVGCQGFATRDYLVTRTGETGSWLARRVHGRGIGTAMRQAICAFVFDHLGGERITSGSFADNPASAAVSRKVGYVPNGTTRLARGGAPVEHQNWLLTPERLVRGEPIAVTGANAFRAFIGLP